MPAAPLVSSSDHRGHS